MHEMGLGFAFKPEVFVSHWDFERAAGELRKNAEDVLHGLET
jgi:hypothetical protein